MNKPLHAVSVDIFQRYHYSTSKTAIYCNLLESFTIERALGVDKIKKDPVIQNEVEIDDMYPIPLLGRVVAGKPINEQEDLEGYIYVKYRPKDEYFAVHVYGDSMINAGILDGSIIICHKQETAECGDIVVAMLNGEQTVKHSGR